MTSHIRGRSGSDGGPDFRPPAQSRPAGPPRRSSAWCSPHRGRAAPAASVNVGPCSHCARTSDRGSCRDEHLRRDGASGRAGYRRSAGSPRGEARRRELVDRVADDLAVNGLEDFRHAMLISAGDVARRPCHAARARAPSRRTAPPGTASRSGRQLHAHPQTSQHGSLRSSGSSSTRPAQQAYSKQRSDERTT